MMHASYLFLAVAALLTTIRLVRGPSLADRVVAMDVLAMISVAILSLTGALHGQPALLDVAAIISLVAFVSTLAFAAAITRRNQP